MGDKFLQYCMYIVKRRFKKAFPHAHIEDDLILFFLEYLAEDGEDVRNKIDLIRIVKRNKLFNLDDE